MLVVNAGSSSLKLQLFAQQKKLILLYKGHIDEIGKKNSHFIESFGPQTNKTRVKIKDFNEGIAYIFKKLLEHRIVNSLDEIRVVGHRVVHGGETYSSPVVMTAAVEKKIQKFSDLAPLHNPANLAAIKACRKILPRIPHVAVFDTAFHQTIPPKAYLYALPYPYYQTMAIRRYGFHGTSHQYVSQETLKRLKKKHAKIIVCHLGNGSSITALKDGISMDTSMGFTPLEGVPMGTRSGDIDPAIVFYLQRKLKISSEKVLDILNNESGLLGLSGLSSDMRLLWQNHEKEGSKRARSVLAYRIAKYIGAYIAVLNGLDAIAFTGGIGENAWYLRDEICSYFKYIGLRLNAGKNRASAMEIHTPGSTIKVYVIPTDEEKQIASELLPLIKTKK